MNGFDLAGRPIRVGLGNDKFTPESTANLLQRFQGDNQRPFQGSAFSGQGGRGAPAGGGNNFDRAGGRDNEKGGGGASALDDTDVAGVNFNNYSRDALMRKLARTDEPAEPNGDAQKRAAAKPRPETKPLPVAVNQASRCVLLRNMFNPAEYVFLLTPIAYPGSTTYAKSCCLIGNPATPGSKSSKTTSAPNARRSTEKSCTSPSIRTLKGTFT